MRSEVEISVVSPVYRAESIIPKLVERIEAALNTLAVTFEIILVEDRGPDDSWRAIEQAAKQNKNVRAFRLSRNFGQHYAITAALEKARGNWVVVMDCDLQDRPEEIPALYKRALEGNDAVVARRAVRNDTWLKKMSSKAYYSVFSYLTDTEQDPAVANFGIYNQKVVEAILSMKDQIRYLPTMLQWVGFNLAYLDVEHSSREEGESSYNWKSLFSLAFDNILAFSDKPLKLTVKLGFWIASVSLLLGIVYTVLYFSGKIEVMGFASLMVSISFFFGVNIMVLGVIGLYLGKVFEKVKGRPLYIISEEIDATNG